MEKSKEIGGDLPFFFFDHLLRGRGKGEMPWRVLLL
jgi:hypothetical protein